MLTRRDLISGLAVAAASSALAATPVGQKQPLATSPNKQALAQQQVEELLLLMDTDKNGRI